jgi:chromosome segregation ATPase
MEATIARPREVEMTESAGVGLEDFMTRMDERFDRIDERFDRAEERTTERFARFEEKTAERFDRVDERFDQVSERFDRTDIAIADLNERVGRVENCIEHIGVQMEGRFEHVEQRIDKLNQGLVNSALVLSGSIVACFAAMLVLIATQL